MDRARTDLIERGEILARFPEFRRLVHRIPYLTKRQNELMLARLARNVMRLGCGCIIWTGACNNDGYARMTVWSRGERRSRVVYAHHVVQRMADGREPQHWQERGHSCDTPPCINPEHLRIERRKFNRQRSAENTNRKIERRRQRERFAALARAA